ncbi:MAG: hypothetical protein RIB47_11240 [Cyclobacteriaceae bacterium]
MDEKINLRAVETYSEGYAKAITDPFFDAKSKITGPEILKLCETQQINLFVIRELLKSWKIESQKYKSPFFDYEHTEVKEALTHFQNVLSNHIAIAKDHFVSLLQKSVSLTVYLILDPYDFYSDTLDKHGKGELKVSDLKNDIKYIKINHQPLERLVKNLEEKKLSTISGNEAFAMLDHILEEVNFTPEDVDTYISQLSKVHPLKMELLYDKKEDHKHRPEKAAAVNTPRASVNEQVKREPVITVADDFQKIDLLKDRLTINQKFMFTKMLFSGDFDLFSNTISQLDKLSTLDEAMSYIDAHYSQWDQESEEYEEFVELLTKRFN